MKTLPEAVTFDFHNTIAICDEWFRLEVYDLLPEFLGWHATEPGLAPICVDPETAKSRYRAIRREIMDHGYEQDAVTCVLTVLEDMDVRIDIDTVERGVREIMCKTLPDSRPVEGIVDTVRSLRANGVRLGVVSSAAYHPFLDWSLEKFGILGDFDAVITSASSGYYKTRAEIYTTAAASLGSQPQDMVHVGDSPEFDVATASRAGMATVLYDPSGDADLTTATGSIVRSLVGVEREIIEAYQRNRV